MSVTNPPKDMNTSKSLADLIDDLVPVHRQDDFRAAIVEAVERLVNRSKKHSLYEDGKLESFILTKDLRKAIKEWQ